METLMVSAETRRDTEAARCDLVRLLEEIEHAHGTYSAQSAAGSLLRATEQGRVVGSSYGYYDEEDGKVYACILGHLDISLDGLGHLGHVPQWEFYNTSDSERRVGRVIENYACGIHKGSTPDTHSHSRNLAAWLRTYIGS